MIVTVKLPPRKRKVQYGEIQMLADPSGNLDVPKYVAKSLVAAGATSTVDLSADLEATLAATEDFSQFHYFFQAHGKNPHREHGGDLEVARTKAADLFNAWGEPSVVFL